MRAALLLLLVFALAADARGDSAPWTHIRAMSVPARHLLQVAAKRSALVRALADEIERSDVVVLFMLSNEPDNENRCPFMRYVSAVGDTRYVVIQLYARPEPPLAQVPVLAHELRHVLELAGAPEARDADSFARLFARIGWRNGPRGFETAAAKMTEELVREELRGSPM